MTTAIIHHPIFKEHDTGAHHPESPSRYSVVMKALREDSELWPKLLEVKAREAPRGDVQACHTPQLYKQIERVVSAGTGYLDADTVVSMKSMDAALHGAGAACEAIDLIMRREVSNAFVPVRPPVITPLRSELWDFVFSTMWLWRLGMRRTTILRSNASLLSIGTCITGMALRESFMTIRRYSFFRCISIRGIREPAPGGKAEWVEAWAPPLTCRYGRLRRQVSRRECLTRRSTT